MKIKVTSYGQIGGFEYAETERVTFFGRHIKETWFRNKHLILWRAEDTGKCAPHEINEELRGIEEAWDFKKAKEKAEAGR